MTTLAISSRRPEQLADSFELITSALQPLSNPAQERVMACEPAIREVSIEASWAYFSSAERVVAQISEDYLEYFDGMSIGSNDMTQLTLGLDRDSGLIADLFDERDEAVKALLKLAIDACRAQQKYIGICGQGPSDHPDLAKWLLDQGIESMSLNPDSVIETWLHLAGLSVEQASDA